MQLQAVWGKIGIGVSMALAVLSMTGCGADTYPTVCDDAGVSETLAGAFNSSRISMLSGLTAVDVTDIEDISGMGDVLSCRALLQFNNAKTLPVAYTVSPNEDGYYWVEYQVIGKHAQQ